MVEKQLGGRLERDWVDGGEELPYTFPGALREDDI